VTLPGVTVELYRDLNADGLPNPGAGDGAALLVTTTNAQGIYSFCPLPEGSFFVRIPAADFQAGGNLQGLLSSPGAGSDNGSDDNVDENGIDNASPSTNGISSIVVTLTNNSEPVNSGTEKGFNSTSDDSDDDNGDMTLDLGFMCPTFTITPASLPAATQYTPYVGVTFSTTGGNSPYAYTLASGALPSGMTLITGGVLSGTPTSGPGTYTVRVRSTDLYGCSDEKDYTLQVNCPHHCSQSSQCAFGHTEYPIHRHVYGQWRHHTLHLCGASSTIASRANSQYNDGRSQRHSHSGSRHL
jgi:hypothetical protein